MIRSCVNTAAMSCRGMCSPYGNARTRCQISYGSVKIISSQGGWHGLMGKQMCTQFLVGALHGKRLAWGDILREI
jgi:hypothetical protein